MVNNNLMKFSIRLLYLYLFAFIGLLVTVIGSVRVVQLALKIYVFKGADRYTAYVTPLYPEGKPEMDPRDVEEQRRINEIESNRQRQREVADSAAMILVGVPLYLYHWKTIQKEGKKLSKS